MLPEYIKKVNNFLDKNKNDIYIAVLIFFVSLASFGLGRLSVLWPKKEPIIITNDQQPATSDQLPEITKSPPDNAAIIGTIKGRYVASKSGTAYHYPWCPGALKIKEENKIWFSSKEEAIRIGYKPAGNCPGL